MSGSETGAPTAERRAWLRDLRRVDERQEDDLAGAFDAHRDSGAYSPDPVSSH